MTNKAADRSDVYSRVTNQIIKAIEAGAGEWRMPWHASEVPLAIPKNALTGKPYRGINVVALWAQSQDKCYMEPTWATYQQWALLGKQVAKGEKATIGIVWKPLDNDGADEPARDNPASDEANEQRWFAKAFSVFNIAQLDDYEPPANPGQPVMPRIEEAEAFFSNLGIDLRHGGNRAYYRPADDFIQMPPFDTFVSPDAYYSTLAHESTHWTGHASRLERDLSGRFGSESYAAEELIAELGAAFIAADLGLSPELRADHAAYIQSWLKILKADNRAIFAAASHAQKAADFLNAGNPTMKPESNPQPQSPTQFALQL
ncbi:MAG: DUF1738 domain-containing protein [Armatimonadetes bacterium]|nr:DUF1738 domain-containing protein [Armatimonadota bacterium]